MKHTIDITTTATTGAAAAFGTQGTIADASGPNRPTVDAAARCAAYGLA